jgi:hypothetical protein
MSPISGYYGSTIEFRLSIIESGGGKRPYETRQPVHMHQVPNPAGLFREMIEMFVYPLHSFVEVFCFNATNPDSCEIVEPSVTVVYFSAPDNR